MPNDVPDEQVAFRLVEMYIRDISQRGEKRQMGLDTIINAYFYTLLRLKKKKKEMGLIEGAVAEEERQIETGVEDIYFPKETGATEGFELE